MKKLNYVLSLTLLAGLFVLSSCEKEEDDPMVTPMPDSKSIAQIASENPNFSILVEAVIA